LYPQTVHSLNESQKTAKKNENATLEKIMHALDKHDEHIKPELIFFLWQKQTAEKSIFFNSGDGKRRRESFSGKMKA
jgi:hypothetical protein